MFTVADYIAQIPAPNNQQPDFVAVVTALITPIVEVQQNLYNMVTTDFFIDTAVGVQLDQIGLWIGRSRQLPVPISGYYFSWDTSGLGWDQAIWFNSYDPVSNIVSLPDDLYRIVLKTKALANEWDGSLEGMYAIMDVFTNATGLPLTVKNNQNNTITVGYSGSTPPSALYAAIIEQGFVPPIPMGVSAIYNLT